MGLLDLSEPEQIKILRKIFKNEPSWNAKALYILDSYLADKDSDTLRRLRDDYRNEFFNLIDRGLVDVSLNDEAMTIVDGIKRIFTKEELT